MKSVSNRFKDEIKKYGRQIDVVIKYNIDGKEYLLDSDSLISIIPQVNGNILESVMKLLEFETTQLIPKNTIISVKFGVLVDNALTVEEVDNMKLERLEQYLMGYFSDELKEFEYISLGTYIIRDEPEYNADTNSYSYVCNDKMLHAMKNYEDLGITYPITIREYINKIAEHIGLKFKNKNDTFANYNKQIKSELYDEKYTFRDVLDELAQVTASTICINEKTDELEIRYITETNDKIDEDYLKDINVEFGEKYGPINSIVLSRSAESDNVFLQDEESINTNGLCELKIIDNQIMNDNDRSDFLPDILDKLNGLQYYINDFSSPGITWYELCDRYTVKINENLYSCVLFNDEIKITQGLEETIYTKMPKETQTDYTKADKTDRKINQTYMIVDKQNQRIEALVSQTTENTEKLSQHEQTIDSITDKVSSVTEELKGDIEQAQNDMNQNLTENYYTRTQTDSQITQKADSITSEVNQSISTAKQEAIDSANSSTDDKLKNYSTTTQMNSAITQKANEITSTVSETYSTKEETNNAKQDAIDTANSATDTKLKNYSTTTQMNSAITQKANGITSEVSKKYSTKEETNTAKQEAIDSANDSTDNKLQDYVAEKELGTQIEQNWEHIKYAWNQISEFIQMEILDGNASLAFRKDANNLLMALDRLGQHFYSNGKVFGEMGVKTVDNVDYISFSLPCEYSKSIQNGLAWGITTPSDGKFHPILFLKNFEMANKESDAYFGQLVLNYCDLVLGSINDGIQIGNIRMYTDALNNIVFEDMKTGEILLNIIPNANDGIVYPEISILGGIIRFYRNAGGTNSFKIGMDNEAYCLMDDTGHLNCYNFYGGKNGFRSLASTSNFSGNINADGNVYAKNISSDRRLKKNIKNSKANALDLIKQIKHRQFEMKEDNNHYDIGYIAQELEKIDQNFVLKRQKTEELEERYYINELPIIATATKAIQEQQEMIEQLQEKDKQKDEIIQDLIKRIENLET